MPVSTPIISTVGTAAGVSVFSGQGVGRQRSGCRSATAYATHKKYPRISDSIRDSHILSATIREYCFIPTSSPQVAISFDAYIFSFCFST